MRLIDADAVLDMMNSQMDMQELYLPIHFKELVIDQLPTAYDVDNVVEQLDVYITKLVGRNSALYQTVMQIVKGGGVDGYFKSSYISLSYGKYKGVCR